jgi:hypothetical protein
MSVLIAIPILGFAVILQSTVLSQIHFVLGSIDLVMLVLIAWAVNERVKTAWQWGVIGSLFASLITAVPLLAVTASYFLSIGSAILLRRIFWQRPILAMLISAALSTVIIHGITIITMMILETPVPIIESLNSITLPSILMNLLVAIPVYAIIGDLANWVYPQPIEI